MRESPDATLIWCFEMTRANDAKKSRVFVYTKGGEKKAGREPWYIKLLNTRSPARAHLMLCLFIKSPNQCFPLRVSIASHHYLVSPPVSFLSYPFKSHSLNRLSDIKETPAGKKFEYLFSLEAIVLHHDAGRQIAIVMINLSLACSRHSVGD